MPKANPKSKMEQGPRIRLQREKLGLSRPQLARKMLAEGTDISDGQIYRWESGKQSPASAAAGALERALGVPPGWLAHGEQATTATTATNANVLSFSGLISLLAEHEASEPERAALSKHLQGRESANERIDESYVVGYLRGLRESQGALAAHGAARNAPEGMMAEQRREVAPPAPKAKRRK